MRWKPCGSPSLSCRSRSGSIGSRRWSADSSTSNRPRCAQRRAGDMPTSRPRDVPGAVATDHCNPTGASPPPTRRTFASRAVAAPSMGGRRARPSALVRDAARECGCQHRGGVVGTAPSASIAPEDVAPFGRAATRAAADAGGTACAREPAAVAAATEQRETAPGRRRVFAAAGAHAATAEPAPVRAPSARVAAHGGRARRRGGGVRPAGARPSATLRRWRRRPSGSARGSGAGGTQRALAAAAATAQARRGVEPAAASAGSVAPASRQRCRTGRPAIVHGP